MADPYPAPQPTTNPYPEPTVWVQPTAPAPTATEPPCATPSPEKGSINTVCSIGGGDDVSNVRVTSFTAGQSTDMLGFMVILALIASALVRVFKLK